MGSGAGIGIVVGAGGLLVTAAAIASIVALAKAASRAKGGSKVVAVLGIIVCLFFVLVGLFATGCGAILSAK